MKDKFLHILKVPERNANCDISKLINYYNSTDLIDALTSLMKERFNISQIQNRKILLKPNLVKHSTSNNDDLCLRTHNRFIIAALNVILKSGPSEVIIGDAPIQGCKWDQMISKSFIQEINKLSSDYKISVQIKDFRRRIYDISENLPRYEINPQSDYLIFDLGKESYLEPVTDQGKTKFRVTNYDPDIMLFAHAPGIHKYCIVKELFTSDIVISLPKIKTHQKTGITGALKNLVGLNGDKDFLPHHRIGGTKLGGDCYPGGSYLRYFSELALDKANRRQGRTSYWFWQKLSSLLWTISFPGPEHNLEAGWYGNDVTWRMVMDLNRIAEYGKADGSISEKKQRQIFSLCDGIIAGQGEGPLNPKPLSLGIISFSNNSLINDLAIARLMDLQADKIPLLNHVPLYREEDSEITLDGMRISLDNLKQYCVKAEVPKGWRKILSETK